jgi:hypothetical protein
MMPRLLLFNSEHTDLYPSVGYLIGTARIATLFGQHNTLRLQLLMWSLLALCLWPRYGGG